MIFAESLVRKCSYSLKSWQRLLRNDGFVVLGKLFNGGR